MDFRSAANQYAQQYGIPPGLFARLVQQESSWNPDAVSSAGAIGLAQLMPGTARELGVNPQDPMQNLEGGARYLRQQYNRFGSWPLALAAYNAGPGRVSIAGGIPNIAETKNYVNRVWGGFIGDTGGSGMNATPSTTSTMAQPQPQGLLGGIGQGLRNMFGGGQPDPNADQPTDPFAGLSRSQRTMLGFAALRDAAASLEGRGSNFFQSALGGFEQARERERLRAQGQMQNRVQALQALATLNEQARFNQAFGLPPDPAMDALRDMLMQSAGLSGGAAQMGGAVPAASPMPAAGNGVGDIAVEPLSPPAQAAMAAPAPAAGPDFAAERQAIFDKMLQRQAAGAGVADLQAQLDDINMREASAVAAQQAGAEESAALETSAAQASGVILPEVDQALDFLVQGFDADGNVIFNPALATRAGRLISGALEGPEYQNFVGAIETLKTGVLLDALSRATVGALSEGEMKALSAEQGMLDPANPIGTFRALNNIQRIAQQSIDRRNRAAGIAAQPSAPSVNWD